jgi:hypothetical protein
MQIYSDNGTKITPYHLIKEGEVWSDLYQYAVSDGDATKMATGLYCLLSSVEMYLKAYIVLKDTSFSDPDRLRNSLSHSFKRMYDEISRLGPKGFSDSVKKVLNRYNLMDVNIANVKYPEDRRMIGIDYGLDKGNHEFEEIFKHIKSEVLDSKEKWMEDAYPKESSIVASLTTECEYKREDITRALLEKWLAMCPACRPAGVILHLRTSYPWGQELMRILTCSECGKVYTSDTMT